MSSSVGALLLGTFRRVFLKRIGVRFLALHLLLLFLPVGALVVFDRYEQQLLQQQEESMVQQARLAVAALETTGPAALADRADALLGRFSGSNVARLRVLDTSARLVADTSEPAGVPISRRVNDPATPEEVEATPTRERILYRIGALPFRIVRDVSATRYQRTVTPDLAERAEVLAGLNGTYGARTRTDGQRLLLHVVLPIRASQSRVASTRATQASITLDSTPATGDAPVSVNQAGIEGVVLASRSTDRIRARVYELRLFLFRVFLGSVVLAIIVNLVLARTIERPLRKLRAEATELVDRKGRLKGAFSASARVDEIGDLTRSLGDLAERLRRQQLRTEEFVADLSHELKNPLAAIRTTVELDPTLGRQESGEAVDRNVARMERMISELAELSRLEAGTPEVDCVDVNQVVNNVVQAWSHHASHTVKVTSTSQFTLRIDPDHVARILINLLDNAAHHSPSNAPIQVSLFAQGERLNLHVRDYGTGDAPGEEERIFERFYSRRLKRQDLDERSLAPQGLGLALVRALAEANGGGARACASTELGDAGARLEVWLPLVT